MIEQPAQREPDALWLAEPATTGASAAAPPAASPTSFHVSWPAIVGVALAVFVAGAWRRLSRRRRRRSAPQRPPRARRSDADLAFARLARLLRLTRAEKAAVCARAAALHAHPAALLVCETIEPAVSRASDAEARDRQA